MSLIKKTWERWRSLGSNRQLQEQQDSTYTSSILTADLPVFSKSKSWGALPMAGYYDPYDQQHEDDDFNIEHHQAGQSSLVGNDGVGRSCSMPSGVNKQNTSASPSASSSLFPSTWLRTPEGCFSVYVGPNRERFVVKAEYANHPQFLLLLEDAAAEYGFTCKGPLLLPCNVKEFIQVLREMEVNDIEDHISQDSCSPCISPKSYNRLSSSSTKSSPRS